ncbi:MAG: hypothetical protein KL840_04105 [Aquamicrobium sp.]|nr:hypothetical protein [Aquamicrobium sp.]
MGGKLALTKMRNLLLLKATELGDPGATTAAIVDAVIRQYPREVEDVSERLLRSSLGRELSRARSKAPTSIEPTQRTLWGSFGIGPQIIVTTESGERINKNLDVCTLAEVQQYASSLPTRRNRSDRKAKITELIESMKRFAQSEDTLLGTAWSKSLEEEEKKAG